MTIIVNFSLDYPEEIRRTGYANNFGSNKLYTHGQYESGEIKLASIFSMSVLEEFLEVNFQAKHCEISSLCS